MTITANKAQITITLANTKDISSQNWELIRSDLSLFLASINAKTLLCPMHGKGSNVIQAVFETADAAQTMVKNYLYLERDFGELAHLELNIDTSSES